MKHRIVVATALALLGSALRLFAQTQLEVAPRSLAALADAASTVVWGTVVDTGEFSNREALDYAHVRWVRLRLYDVVDRLREPGTDIPKDLKLHFHANEGAPKVQQGDRVVWFLKPDGAAPFSRLVDPQSSAFRTLDGSTRWYMNDLRNAGLWGETLWDSVLVRRDLAATHLAALLRRGHEGGMTAEAVERRVREVLAIGDQRSRPETALPAELLIAAASARLRSQTTVR